MNLLDLLHEQENAIVDEATEALNRSHLKHYTAAGDAWNRQRLQTLYQLSRAAVADRNLIPLMDYMEQIAQERFAAGFGIHEVQTAVNVLEESIWRHISQTIPPAGLAEAFGLIGTVLGAAKDALARAYVTLASHSKAPSLNMEALFRGAAS
ncbi:MAG: hypothetical protein IPM39_21850 [Chloroflexi bacterium]|nr:hypothetical protein [Chloroflexota bacterium]